MPKYKPKKKPSKPPVMEAMHNRKEMKKMRKRKGM